MTELSKFLASSAHRLGTVHTQTHVSNYNGLSSITTPFSDIYFHELLQTTFLFSIHNSQYGIIMESYNVTTVSVYDLSITFNIINNNLLTQNLISMN